MSGMVQFIIKTLYKYVTPLTSSLASIIIYVFLFSFVLKLVMRITEIIRVEISK